MLVFSSICNASDDLHATPHAEDTTQDLNSSVIVLDAVTKTDENAIAMMTIPEGGRMSHCVGSGAIYLRMTGVDNMFAVAESPPYDMSSPTRIKFASHDTLSNIFPTVAVLFANQSSTGCDTSFRLYTVNLLDLVAEPQDGAAMYRMEILNVTETIGTEPTYAVPLDMIFSDSRSITFPSGTMMMDLIDVDDVNVDEERKKYTIAHMSRSGELAYNADKLTRRVNGEELVGAQGVTSNWGNWGLFGFPYGY